MGAFDVNIKAKLDSRYLRKPVAGDDNYLNIDVNQQERSIQQSYTASDLWDGDMQSIPYEPTCEESAMEQMDEHIGQQIMLKKAKGPVVVKVISRYRDTTGALVGTKNTTPQLDTRIYNVEFPNGHYERYSSNILTKALSESIDSNGYETSY